VKKVLKLVTGKARSSLVWLWVRHVREWPFAQRFQAFFGGGLEDPSNGKKKW
jgi:hypothetical protein